MPNKVSLFGITGLTVNCFLLLSEMCRKNVDEKLPLCYAFVSLKPEGFQLSLRTS